MSDEGTVRGNNGSASSGIDLEVDPAAERARTLPSWVYQDPEALEAQRVQKGVPSRLYDRGRYSRRREVGTHHFHTVLDRFRAG